MNQVTAAHIKLIDSYIQQLPTDELMALWNGVGSEHWLLKRFNLPEYWQERFKFPSIFHDVGCHVGGTKNHADIVHWEFFMRCMREAGLLITGQFWAFVAWRAVKATSKYNFDTRDTPLNYEQLRELAQRKMQGINKL